MLVMFPGQSWTGGSSSPAASESMHHHHHQGYSTLFGKHGTPLAAAVHGGYRVPHFLACWVCRKHILIHQWNVKALLFSSKSRQFFISGCCYYSDCGLLGLRYVMIWLQNLSGKALKVGVEILLQCIIEAEAKKVMLNLFFLEVMGP